MGQGDITLLPPHSLEAECGVIGSILMDVTGGNSVLDLCIQQGLIEDSFYQAAHRTIYATILEMSQSGTAIDSLTLTERLRLTKRIDGIGGSLTIQKILDATPTASHAEYYINIVRQKHLLRSIILCSRDAEKRCYEDALSADVILSEVEQRFLSIADRRDSSGVTWPQALTSSMTLIEQIFQMGTSGGLMGLPTGFRDLDKKLKGLRKGEMIVIAARPSVGKTSLAMNIAECVAMGKDINRQPMKGDHDRPHAVAVFSLEMSTEALAMRMLCGYAGVEAWKISEGLGSGKMITSKLTHAASQLRQAPLYIDDTGGLDIMDMRARARRFKKQYNIELIVIDYLQLCKCNEYAKFGTQIVTAQISGHIKAMAKELNVPVVVLSQLSRANERRGDASEKPKLSDLRDSGAIEQDADVVMLLRRPSRSPGSKEYEDKRLAYVDVAKQRNGPTGEVKLDFDGDLTRFGDRAQEGAMDQFAPQEY